ncbi:hypothetical protein [Petrocella sp. FN5]|uniref:hypothetical protein n=1 Tax=Petrocella sp. FN5 TaxID=3032002 RepID=UPI0023DCD07F|nr:hypothetical protein [Petrocella sp. FN5]MDF1618011.1 hypothetical protein [Petrocella sp. FN5]
MEYEIKLKTGFYETANYYLSPTREGIKLLPIGDVTRGPIVATGNELISITLTQEKKSNITIMTRSQILTGDFQEKLDLKEVYEELKKHINAKIVYEEFQES